MIFQDVTPKLTLADIRLENPREPSLPPVDVQALVDSGSVHLCIPEHVMIQLKFAEIDKKRFRRMRERLDKR